MTDEIEDVTHRTIGKTTYEGTASFSAEGEQYGLHAWLFRADDDAHALKVLDELSNDCMYADPRIDYVRDLEVEEQDDVLHEDGEPAEA